MSNKAVIGLGYGDCGKGVVTEYLCSQDPENTIVVRFSGGQQAGHKVVKRKPIYKFDPAVLHHLWKTEDVEHIFSSFGAGTLSGCPTYWSQYCTFDPVGFWNEYQILKEKGISPKIYIYPDCPVTTIYDVFANRNGDEIEHGTTGTGFGKTWKRHFDVRFDVYDLLCWHYGRIDDSLKDIEKYYGIKEKVNLNVFHEAVVKIRSLVERGIITVTDQIPDYKHKVFEGSQGLMLDEHIGTMPHCSPSDITPRNAMKMADLDEIFLVTRAYQTRHGKGPMTNEQYSVKLVNNERETNVCNKYQGEFKTTVLDLDQLVHAKKKGIDEVVPKSTKINLVMTCIDQLSTYSYTSYGHKIDGYHGEYFAKIIRDNLDINGDLYINDSPYSDSIRKI